MAIYQVLCWKHIPAQIRVFEGKKPVAHPMPDWFQQEIDRVAMREGLVGTDDYLNAWQWSERREYSGDPKEVAPLILAEVERVFEASSGQ